jgi:uncharacterized protein (TIGR03084 family)
MDGELGVPDVVEALKEELGQLDRVLASLDVVPWGLPSRCEGWSVSDVVLHLAQTDELVVATMDGRFDDIATSFLEMVEATVADDPAAAAVAQERGDPPAAIYERWRTGAEAMTGRLTGGDPHRRVVWTGGVMSLRTVATTRLAEAWIHGGDVGVAVDWTPPATDRLWHVARLAWRTLPYAFRRADRELTGPVALHLTAPGDGREWRFAPDHDGGTDGPLTVVEGRADELCQVAAHRRDPDDTTLQATGPDAAAVLELITTYA